MIVLNVSKIEKSFGVERVLKDVTFSLAEGERLGLVGVNGSGKTTLLRILAGELEPDDGDMAIQKGMRVGYLQQSYQPPEGMSVRQALEEVYQPVFALEQRIRQLEIDMAGADEQTLRRMGDEYEKLTRRFEREDGYACHSRVQGVLQGLGFKGERQHQEARKLSGGELTRLTLGRLLLQRPDLLLLDEPTNHLDLDALKWLEEFLTDYPGALIVVSHDRYFLDKVCTGMVELLFGVAEQYTGNYSRYMEQREERFLARSRAYAQQQKEIERQQAIIARFRSFNREKSIRAAESRQKALDRMELLEKPQEERQLSFRFTAYSRMGNDALRLEGLSKSFGERKLFEDVDLLLQYGDRAALIGANGIGKSTLLEGLMGKLKFDSGRFQFGTNADVGYYDQKQQSLNPENTVLREVWDDFPRLLQHEVRGALGLFLFTGDDVFKPVSALSGGEKARVALTKLMLRHNNFLILDEPTNHLDSDSREVLEDALEGFQGTILAVSHDRYFINRFATRLLVLTPGGIQNIEGNYDSYLAWLDRQNNPDQAQEEGLTRTEIVKQRRLRRAEEEQLKAHQEAVSRAEDQVSLCEESIKLIERSLMDPDTYTDPDAAAQAAKDLKDQQAALERAMRRWEKAELALSDFLAEREAEEG